MSDEHRADITGYEGNNTIRTPVLDYLAETGTVFRNAYTASPVCVPGRQCLMSGQMPNTHGCDNFWSDLPPGHMTFSRKLNEYAYNTVCAGKLHHTGVDQMQGWTERISPDAWIAPKYIKNLKQEEFNRYKPKEGTGHWSNEKQVKEFRIDHGPYQKFDENAVKGALEYIEKYFIDKEYNSPQSHRPLLLKVSLLQPHYPFFTDQERYDYYYDKVNIYNDEKIDHPVLSLSQQEKPVNVSPEEVRSATTSYYGMIDRVDTDFGDILNELKRVGENLDDWIIIYTSDHGEMLGEHGIWEKTRFYEGSVRVPLIIRWPEKFKGGQLVNENVNLCDLFATICDLTGIPIPEGLDSRSLVPFLEGKSIAWSNETLSQFNKDHFMIKKDFIKYQYYGEGVEEVLFDLGKDPGEYHNEINNPEYKGKILEFRKRLAQLGHGVHADPDYVNTGY